MVKRFINILLLLLAFGCSDDNSSTRFNSDLIPYVDRFVAEANARGHAVDTRGLIAEFKDNLYMAGNVEVCGLGSFSTPHIQISHSSTCWVLRTETNREILVFHELGHTILKRQHDDAKLPDGVNYKSIMHAANIFGMYTESQPDRRKYYVDELFDPSTLAPGWAGGGVKTTKVILNDSIGAVGPWQFMKTIGLDQVGTISNSVFSSPSHSLSITGNVAYQPTDHCQWNYELLSDVPAGSQLVLTVNVKTSNITGSGVYVVFTGGAASHEAFSQSTAFLSPIIGTQEFKPYTLKVSSVPEPVQKIAIYLILDGSSTGTAYFDDVKIVNVY